MMREDARVDQQLAAPAVEEAAAAEADLTFQVAPEAGIPLFPIPVPFPLRRTSPSGSYVGTATGTAGAVQSQLELRVDISPRYANSPVMNTVSGDFFTLHHIVLPGKPPMTLRTYQSSWVVTAPKVTWAQTHVDISGPVQFWSGGVQLATTVTMRIPLGIFLFSQSGPADVTFQSPFTSTHYVCPFASDCFRAVNLEVDVCQSVNQDPILPSYDTRWHNNRPASLPGRVLTIETAYREAGVKVTLRPDHTVIDDSAAAFQTWTAQELHHAMEDHFSQYNGPWPAWEMWGLLAGTFEQSGVGGIMFDAGAAYGGAGVPPERQGFAVFRKHQWFTHLVAGTPANQDQAWAMRHYLYTWVHEAGHAYNLLHSWNKNRPDALSWMNYDWKYDARNGADSFWAAFQFRFDDPELAHIRHGSRHAVIMGGDPWASGGHLEAPAAGFAAMEGDAPLSLLLRSQGYFEFMEPVSLELRLKNELNLPVDVDGRLLPDDGNVAVFIRRPDGQTMHYRPIFCNIGVPKMVTLGPTAAVEEGEDRVSDSIFLSYGADGFCFDMPGEYLVAAVYHGPGTLLVTSNVHRLRVGHPLSAEADRAAQAYFDAQVGMALYLHGSPSQYLADGMQTLSDISARFPHTMLGARVAARMADGLAKPFFTMADKTTSPRLVETHAPDPETALALTQPALQQFQQQASPRLNLEYHDLVRRRAGYLKQTGRTEEAKQEVTAMRRDLAARGVNKPVLDEITAFADAL